LLGDGKVLVCGGNSYGLGIYQNTAEIFDPANGTWSPIAPMSTAREQHLAVLLADGRVLVSGGQLFASSTTVIHQSSEIYDPVDGLWRATGNRVASTTQSTAFLMPDGKVIATGGNSLTNGLLDSSEIFNPVSGFWDRLALLATPRSDAPAALLPGGQLLLVGGKSTFSALSSTELLGPVAILPSGVEGSSVSRTGTFSDPEGNGTVTLSASTGMVTQNIAAGTWSWTASRDDGPTDTVVMITARDTFNASASVAISFPVTNAVPTLTISGPPSAVAGASVDFTLTASDPSTVDQAAGFAWSINFGDGTAPLTVAAGTASPLVRSRAFANSGVYTVTATATDKDGGVSLSASHQITIAGPPSIIPFNYPAYSATTLTAVLEGNDRAMAFYLQRGMKPTVTYLMKIRPEA